MIQRADTATIADLYKVSGKAELINGEIVHMSPASAGHGRATIRILQSLLEYEERMHNGYAFGDNIGFVVDLPNRRSFSPDVAYFIGVISEREFVDGAPTFAVEIRSPEEFGAAAERKIAAKRADYFAAGTRVVWDVDMIRDKVVRVYRATAPEQPTLYHAGENAEAEPAVPGWTMAVSDLLR